MSKMDRTAAVLQIGGAGAIVAAGFAVTMAFGLAVLGVSLIVFGLAVERRR